MREPGGDDEPIPFDSQWWADFNRRCRELTAEEIAGMCPAPEFQLPKMEVETLEETFTKMRARYKK